jgi:hypothetical protein
MQFVINYTWSHSIDDSSSSNGDDSIANPTGPWPLDAFNASRDRGSSDFDQRHHVAAHLIWQVPLAQHSTDWAKRVLLAGWAIAGLISYQTGQPFSIVDGESQVNPLNIPALASSESSRPPVLSSPTWLLPTNFSMYH